MRISKLQYGWVILTVLTTGLSNTGCVYLHSAQVGDVDSEIVSHGQRFEIRVSEGGFNLQEGTQLAASMAKAAGRSSDTIESVSGIIQLFQVGPKTGNPVFTDDYSDDLIHQLKLKCPSGRISGLTSVRETAKYPVVSGEVVKLIGYCLKGDM